MLLLPLEIYCRRLEVGHAPDLAAACLLRHAPYHLELRSPVQQLRCPWQAIESQGVSLEGVIYTQLTQLRKC